MRWTESVVVDRAAEHVLAAVRDEHEVMRWSAWPEATGFSCAVETGDGRETGSEIVFRDPRGREQGRQRLAGVRTEAGATGPDAAHVVEYRLTNRGPGGRTMRPEVDFRLTPLGADRTRVDLVFRADLPLPRPLRGLLERVMAPRIRALHVADLDRLKAHVEGTTPAAVDPAA